MVIKEVVEFIESNLDNDTVVSFWYNKPDGTTKYRTVTLKPPLTADDRNYKPGVNFYGEEQGDSHVKLWRFDRVDLFAGLVSDGTKFLLDR